MMAKSMVIVEINAADPERLLFRDLEVLDAFKVIHATHEAIDGIRYIKMQHGPIDGNCLRFSTMKDDDNGPINCNAHISAMTAVERVDCIIKFCNIRLK